MLRGGILASLQLALNLAETGSTRLLPALVGAPAEIAGARQGTFWVETGVLVQGDQVGSVRRTEDVAAMAAVMTTQEETKGGATGGRVAVRRSRVSLPMLPRRQPRHLAQMLVFHPLILGQLADAAAAAAAAALALDGGPTTGRTAVVAVQTIRGVMSAAGRSRRR